MTEEVIKVKNLLRSKTFWVSAITVALSAGSYLTRLDIVRDNPHILSTMGVLGGILMFSLRLLTTQPLVFKSTK
jgi:hypothetical protein